MKKQTVGLVLLGAALAAGSWAQETPAATADDRAAMAAQIKDLEERLIALEGQVRALKAASASAAAAPAVAEAMPVQSTSTPLVFGGNSAAAKALNPDISIIGDFIGVAGGNSINPGPALQMHESEIGMSAIIDPYARGDFFLSFGEQGVNLEEGFITFTSLPAGFVVKAGKMRSAFGKINTMHNHVLPFVDRPLATENLVGGEDGIDDAGFSINRILPAPKGIFLDITGQVFRGDSGTDELPVFRSSRRSDVSTVAHLRAYKDLTESTNLDIGLSFARGHNDLGTNFLTHLYGVDTTVRWRPLRRSIYHSFVGRSEFFWSQRQQQPFTQRAFGYYTSAEYQLGRRWFVGGRWDWSDRARLANQTDKGGSFILTYWPSEFSQIRGQYRLTNYAENVKANELLFQVLFSLGAHGAHSF
jgi:hypothetical protein